MCCRIVVVADEDGGAVAGEIVAVLVVAPAFSGVKVVKEQWRICCSGVVVSEVGSGGCRGGWKERRKLGLGFWEMKMMTWQNLSG